LLFLEKENSLLMEKKIAAPAMGRGLESPRNVSKDEAFSDDQPVNIAAKWAEIKKVQQETRDMTRRIGILSRQSFRKLSEAYKGLNVKSQVLISCRQDRVKKFVVFRVAVVQDIDSPIHSDSNHQDQKAILLEREDYPLSLPSVLSDNVADWQFIPVVGQSIAETRTLIKLCLPDYRILLT